MQRNEFFQQDILEIAQKANDYARQFIVHGSSQIENNALEPLDFSRLDNSVEDIRGMLEENAKRRFNDACSLDTDYAVSLFETRVALSIKYSLGNCDELAFLALDYILNNEKNIEAEVYDIKDHRFLARKGNHRFLVINRDPESDPCKPATWGENAVICDPWADKVFLASEYLTELKNFKRILVNQKSKNVTEDFNPRQLAVVPACYTVDGEPQFYYNSQLLRPLRSVDNLKAVFTEKSGYLLGMLDTYRSRLEERRETLQKKYGEKHEKVLLLANKIDEIDKFRKEIDLDAQNLLTKDFNDDYREACRALTTQLKAIYKGVVPVMQFESEKIATLSAKEGFFPSGTKRTLAKAALEINQSLNTLHKR